MDYISIVEKYRREFFTPEVMDFGMFEFLFDELKLKGFSAISLGEEFLEKTTQCLAGSEPPQIQLEVTKRLLFWVRTLPVDVIKEEVKKTQVVSAPTKPRPVVEDLPPIEEFDVNDIPDEEDEGDPLYVAPEDMISLNPEDCDPMEIDWEFVESVGGKREDNE